MKQREPKPEQVRNKKSATKSEKRRAARFKDREMEQLFMRTLLRLRLGNIRWSML